MRVSVIGGGRIDEATYGTAREVGRLLGERGHTVVCGGLGGVMEAACRGVHDAREGVRRDGVRREEAPRNERAGVEGVSATDGDGGRTVGILPGTDPGAANEYVDTAVATGMGNARNVLVVLNGDAAIAVDGATGTLSELGHALDFGRPVAGIGAADLGGFRGFEAVETPAEAVESVERRVG
ncbi:Rossmann fold nucleotide-binding protein [Halomarina pelagica]|uniref:SLOG cluster 4 domain-containing protein n=1 Tax=Halomarina pelagica TaxID=2961599 RepID=UPI0020C4ABE6|nr:Rossmann fold nucleotide-binding protein [Halomarina sp. BND7]